MECLRDRKDELLKTCRKYIFYHEEMQFADNQLDLMLQRKCRVEIQEFCQTTDRSKVLSCLKQHSRDSQMSSSCREVVQTRMREQVINKTASEQTRSAFSLKKLFSGWGHSVATESPEVL